MITFAFTGKWIKAKESMYLNLKKSNISVTFLYAEGQQNINLYQFEILMENSSVQNFNKIVFAL